MRRDEKESVSLWHQHEKPMLFAPLRKNTLCDVCVIGAGISGLTTAYLLQQEGKSVIVVDAWGLAAGETGRTTAHLTSAYDDGYYALEKYFSIEDLRLFAASHIAAIDKIEAIVKAEKIKCDFERVEGYLTAMTTKQEDSLDREIRAYHKVGFENFKYVPRLPLPQIQGGPALHLPNQATLHISKYMTGLAKAFLDLGGKIYTGTRIIKVEDQDRPYAETEDGHRIRAEAIVVATNTPIVDWVKMHTKQAAYRTYVIAFKIPKYSYQPFLLWDLEDPYHYARIVRGDIYDYMVIGGEDHKTGQANNAAERYDRLENWSRAHFTNLGAVACRWSGQVMEPVDDIAFIGRNPGNRNVFIVTGDSGNGITHGTIAGMLLTDLIMHRPNPWQKIYDPARKNLKSAGTYIKENANFVGCMVSDWAAPSEVEKAEYVGIGEGAILRSGVSKVAVYRDEQGSLHKCSAVCTHLGCVVQWNSGEKSWDCPCHGSRFSTDGSILNGPAIKPLEEIFDSDTPRPEKRPSISASDKI